VFDLPAVPVAVAVAVRIGRIRAEVYLLAVRQPVAVLVSVRVGATVRL
jgi:hypothetical protein